MKHATPVHALRTICLPQADGVWRIAQTAAVVLLAALSFTAAPIRAQQTLPPRAQNGSRPFNPNDVTFGQAWTAAISDPVKLIEIGPVVEEKKNSLLLLIGGREPTDYKRRLIVTHWDGARFVPDTTSEFSGTALDALLAGRFRPSIRTVAPAAAPQPKGKKPRPQPTSQIVTTEGVYVWNGSSFTRLFASPPNLKLALILEGTPDQMVINYGDSSTIYEAGETDSHPSAYLLQPNDPGYVRMAVGTQTYEGLKDFTTNVRFMQSFWHERARWEVGLERGRPLAVTADPNATTGDRLVVYTPKLANRDKPFWKLTRADDFDLAWRSDPLLGRVLDVRVGDPKNEGKDGILVLTAENNDKERHLYFYLPTAGRSLR